MWANNIRCFHKSNQRGVGVDLRAGHTAAEDVTIGFTILLTGIPFPQCH